MHQKRTHDNLYLKEDRYEHPKESFKFQLAVARESCRDLAGMTVCDVGCATGEFLYYLGKEEPEARIEGFDLLPELIEKAVLRVPAAKFSVGSVLDGELLPAGHADVIFMSGVLGIFDSFEACMNNLIGWLKPGGRAFVFALFNSRPVDVRVKAKKSTIEPDDTGAEDAWEPGWNIYSCQSVGRFLDRHPAGVSFQFHDFSIDIDLAEQPNDPLRSWTETLANGRRLIVNGLCILHDFKLLEIQKTGRS